MKTYIIPGGTGAYPYGTYPPGTYPPGINPTGAYSPGTYQPNSSIGVYPNTGGPVDTTLQKL